MSTYGGRSDFYTKRIARRRWAGPHEDVTAAVELAVSELELWSGMETDVSVRIAYRGSLSERSTNPHVLERLHLTSLHDIEEIDFEFTPSREVWSRLQAEHSDAALRKRLGEDDVVLPDAPKPLLDASISISLTKERLHASRVEVAGPDRTKVEGLATRLNDELCRTQSWPSYALADAKWLVAIVFFWIGIPVGTLLGNAFAVGNYDSQTDPSEWTVYLATSTLVASLAFAVAAAFPSLELLGASERSLFERYRTRVVGLVSAVVVAVASSAIWGLMSSASNGS